MKLISWFELKHLIGDCRAGRWHDYPYAKPGDLLYPLEIILRRLSCARHGHRYYGGANGEYQAVTWKCWCAVCFDVPEWAREKYH